MAPEILVASRKNKTQDYSHSPQSGALQGLPGGLMPDLETTELRKTAEGIFVNRDGQLRKFHESLNLLKQLNGPQLLVFHGPFGYGKSSLLARLIRDLGPANQKQMAIGAIEILDHGDIPFVSALSLFAQALEKKSGLKFGAFKLALADYLDTRPDERPRRIEGTKVIDPADMAREAFLEGIVADLSDFAKDGLQGVAESAAKHVGTHTLAELAGLGVEGIPFGGAVLKRLGGMGISHVYRQHLISTAPALETLYGQGKSPKEAEIRESLGDVLAHELSIQLDRKRRQAVLFIDGYEKASEYHGIHKDLFPSNFERAIRDLYLALYERRVPVLIVIMGGDGVKWDLPVMDWAEDFPKLHQKVAGIERSHANEMLTKFGLEQVAIDNVLDASWEGEEEAKHWCPIVVRDFDIRHKTMQVLPGPVGASTRREFLDVYKPYADELLSPFSTQPGLLEMLRWASCCGILDEDLVNRLALRLNTSILPSDLDKIVDSSLFYMLDDSSVLSPWGRNFIMPGPLAYCIGKTLTEKDTGHIHRELAEIYLARSLPLPDENVRSEHSQSMKKALTHAAKASRFAPPDNLKRFREGEFARVYYWQPN